MHHHRGLLFGVGANVEGAKPRRKVEVDLGRAALPLAPDGVAQRVFELGAIEGALPRLHRGFQSAPRQFVEHLLQSGLSLVPSFVRAHALFRPRRELHHHVAEAEVAIDRQDHVVDLKRLLHDLVFRAENMRVVLGEGAHAHHAVQRARGLVAMHDAEFGNAHGQIAIGLQPVLEDQHMARAVHRL